MILIRRITGISMLPHFRPGMLVFALKYKQPQAGDVVIAKQDGREIIKRIKAVGYQGFFLLGDNEAHSTDSRLYGWFDPPAIKGVVIARLAQ